jgi:hypothetical protein
MDNSTTGVDAADPKFPITEAQLTGNFCETLTYGIYLTTCTFCVRTLLMDQYGRWRKLHEIRWYLVSVAVILFGVSTFDVIIGLIHNIKAFVDYHGQGGAPEELTNIRDWINVSRVSLFFLVPPSNAQLRQSVAQAVNMIIGDMVLVGNLALLHHLFVLTQAIDLPMLYRLRPSMESYCTLCHPLPRRCSYGSQAHRCRKHN